MWGGPDFFKGPIIISDSAVVDEPNRRNNSPNFPWLADTETGKNIRGEFSFKE